MKDNDDVVLLCEYCGAAIDIKKHKCPSCGADCSKIIKKYKDEEKKKADAEKERVLKMQEQVTDTVLKSFRLSNKIGFIVFGVIFVVAIFIFVSVVIGISSNSKKYNNKDDDNWFDSPYEEKTKKSISVGFNELAKNSDYTLILDSYELYNHVSDKFPAVYNTKDGYQKVAFHFIIENKDDSDYTIHGFNSFNLTADDYAVESADLEACVFCYAAEGREKYDSLLDQTIKGGSKLQGYVGFEVPTDKKKLVFSYDNISITMDNPAYKN